MKKLIPADTVDAHGNVWDTVGENIRHGIQDTNSDVKSIVDIMFPVGSVYCGENPFVLSVGVWKQLTDNAGLPIVLAGGASSGTYISVQEISLVEDSYKSYISLRVYRREA